MRLSNLHEAGNRRDFLKRTAGAAVSAATGGLDKLAGIGGKIATRSFVPLTSGEPVWDFMQATYFGVPNFNPARYGTPEQLADCTKRIFAGEFGASRPYGMLDGIWDAGKLDQYTNGAFAKSAREYVERVGPAKALRDWVDSHSEYGCDSFEGIGHKIQKVSEMVPTIRKFFQLDKYDLDNIDQVFQMLRQRGAVSDSTLKKYYDGRNQARKRREEIEREDAEYDAEQRRVEVDDKYSEHEKARWADDGGRVNENFSRRLQRAFTSLRL